MASASDHRSRPPDSLTTIRSPFKATTDDPLLELVRITVFVNAGAVIVDAATLCAPSATTERTRLTPRTTVALRIIRIALPLVVDRSYGQTGLKTTIYR